MSSFSFDAEQAVAIIAVNTRGQDFDDSAGLLRLLRQGGQTLRTLSDAELDAAGVPRAQRQHPRFVARTAHMDNADLFDPEAFDLTPRQAEQLDPQIRQLLLSSRQCLAAAGYLAPRDAAAADGGGRRLDDLLGVFATSNVPAYFMRRVLPRLDQLGDGAELTQAVIGSGQDFAANWLAYVLGATGPTLNIQTACSSGLVTVASACQGLLDLSCDTALVAAVSIADPARCGYRHEPGHILSADGHCRPFDHEASGTLVGDGAATLLLRRYQDAVAAGDPVLALIHGWGINNDGQLKAGFTAPSREGQRRVILAAQAMAGVRPDQLDYIEAHGTGTALGDAIEMAALNDVFDQPGGTAPSCAIGAIKANLGHLETAAGLFGLAKVVLALNGQWLPATPGWRKARPDLAGQQRFRFLPEGEPWPASAARPRLAGVSAFGFGGTNCHMILGEAAAPSPAPSSALQASRAVLPLSAHSQAALARAVQDHIQALQQPAPADSLANGLAAARHCRPAGPWRLAVTGGDCDTLLRSLRQAVLPTAPLALAAGRAPRLGFVVNGQGSLSASLGLDLLHEPAFAASFQASARAFAGHGLQDLEALTRQVAAAGDAAPTDQVQPVLFAVCLALWHLLEHHGYRPAVAMGHSLGEIVVAAASGVLDLADAARLTLRRGQAMAAAAEGGMLAVAAPPEQLAAWLDAHPALTLAAVNGPRQTVVSGAPQALAALSSQLHEAGLESRRLPVTGAFHSPLMASAAATLAPQLAGLPVQAAALQVISTLTGSAIEHFGQPAYWLQQMQAPVRFTDALLAAAPEVDAFVEIGARCALAGGARATLAQAGLTPGWITTLDGRHPDPLAWARTQAALFEAGAPLPALDIDPLPGLAWLPAPAFALRPFSLPLPQSPAPSTPVAVAAPDQPAAASSATSQDPLLCALVELWQNELGVPQLDADSDFFLLGGASLTALTVVRRLETLTGLSLSPALLMAHPTPRRLLAALEQELGHPAGSPP